MTTQALFALLCTYILQISLIFRLVFAADSIVCIQATRTHVAMLILRIRDSMGQQINLNKAMVNFSRNVWEDAFVLLRQKLKAGVESYAKKHLGILSLMGRSKQQV